MPSRLRCLWATFSSRPRDHDTAKVVSQRSSGSGLSALMREGELWHHHLHRLKELDRDVSIGVERRAARTLIVMAAGVFVTMAALLTVVRLFGLPPETQYAMVQLF